MDEPRQQSERQPGAAVFIVLGSTCPGLLGRVLGLISQQGLVPVTVTARRLEAGLSIRIVQDDISNERAAILAAKMRSLVTVRAVRLRCRERQRQPLSRLR